MGVRANIREIRSDAFSLITAGQDFDSKQFEQHFLDKEWSRFYMAFKDKGDPLDLAIKGDLLHPESSHTFESFYEEDHDYYLGFMTPPAVQRISAALNGLTLAEVQRWYHEQELEFDDDSQSKFDLFKRVYREAAIRGNGLMIVIA